MEWKEITELGRNYRVGGNFFPTVGKKLWRWELIEIVWVGRNLFSTAGKKLWVGKEWGWEETTRVVRNIFPTVGKKLWRWEEITRVRRNFFPTVGKEIMDWEEIGWKGIGLGRYYEVAK